MRILFQPEQDEMIVTMKDFYIQIHLNNQTGDTYTISLDEETASFLIRQLLEHIWLLEHASELIPKRQELIPF